jgi:uncharacterized protein YkvS
MSEYEKLEWLHFAISEAINGNIGELSNALEVVEQLREPHLASDLTYMQRYRRMYNEYRNE